MREHRGVAIPPHLQAHADRVPDDILNALAPVDLVARCLAADEYTAKAEDANRRRDHTLATGYRGLAEETLSAPVDTVDNRAEVAELLVKADQAGGEVARGYRQRAEELRSALRPDDRFVSTAKRLIGYNVAGSTRMILKRST